MRQWIVTSHNLCRPGLIRHQRPPWHWAARGAGFTLGFVLAIVSLLATAQANSETVLSVGGYSGARISNTANTDASLSTDLGVTGNAGFSWRSGSRSLNSAYSLTTQTSVGNLLDLENAEGRLDQQITGAARFAQQARNNLWDISLGHEASLYNPGEGLTLNPFDLVVLQGLSANGGLNLQSSARTRLRLEVNAGTSVDVDYEGQGSTLGWSALAMRQLNPRASGSVQVSQTAVYSPETDDPVLIYRIQLSLSRVLRNGSVSGSAGINQFEVEGANYESVTGSLARRWQWSEHQGELSYNRAISNPLLDLTTLEPVANNLEKPGNSSPDEPPGDTFKSLSLNDSVRLVLTTERWCSLCTNTLTIAGKRTQRLSSVPELADEQYSATASVGMTVRVTTVESVNFNYQWQGQGLGPNEPLQQRNQLITGWQRSLDRRLTVGGTAQVQWLKGSDIDNRDEWSLRASATYQLGAVQ